MPAAPRKPGLGTGIIEALAGRLGAVVAVAPANPGTRVSITCAYLTTKLMFPGIT
jgi:hypothetical protein